MASNFPIDEATSDLEKQRYDEYNRLKRKGLALAKIGLHERAISQYEKAIKINPKINQSFLSKGISLFELDRIEEALVCFNQILNYKLSSNSTLVYLYKGKALKKLGNYEEAIKNFDEELKINSYCSETRLEKGRALCKLGEYEKAINEYNQVIQNDKKNYIAITLKGIALNKMGLAADARKQFNEALSINPDYVEAFIALSEDMNPYNLNKKGKDLASEGKYDEAISKYDLAIQYDPKYSEAFKNKGEALLLLGKPDDAILCFQVVSEILKASAIDLYNNNAKAYMCLNQYNEAIVYLDNSLKQSNECYETYLLKGEALYQLKKYTEAIELFDLAISLQPDCFSGYYYKGLIFQDQVLLDKAIEQFDIAISKQPDYLDSYYCKIKSLFHLAKFEETMELVDKVNQMNPNDDSMLIVKGRCLRKLNKYKEAIIQYDNFIKNTSNRIKALEHDSIVFKEQGNHEKAEKEIEKAKELRKSLREPYFLKSQVLLFLGRVVDALQNCELSIKSDNTYFDARLNKTTCLVMLQRHQDAINEYNILIEQNPTSYEAHLHYGINLSSMAEQESQKNITKYFKLAISQFDKVIQLYPHIDSPYVAKGIVLNKLGRYKEAIKEFDNALERNPNLSSAYYNKYLALKSLNRVNEANEARSNATRINANMTHEEHIDIKRNDSRPFRRMNL